MLQLLGGAFTMQDQEIHNYLGVKMIKLMLLHFGHVVGRQIHWWGRGRKAEILLLIIVSLNWSRPIETMGFHKFHEFNGSTLIASYYAEQ